MLLSTPFHDGHVAGLKSISASKKEVRCED